LLLAAITVRPALPSDGAVTFKGITFGQKTHLTYFSCGLLPVKKSVPASSAKWVRMNADQVVVRLRSGTVLVF
jgi:hypothetical protein